MQLIQLSEIKFRDYCRFFINSLHFFIFFYYYKIHLFIKNGQCVCLNFTSFGDPFLTKSSGKRYNISNLYELEKGKKKKKKKEMYNKDRKTKKVLENVKIII